MTLSYHLVIIIPCITVVPAVHMIMPSMARLLAPLPKWLSDIKTVLTGNVVGVTNDVFIWVCLATCFTVSSQCQPYSSLLCHAIYAILPMPALFWLVMACYLCYPPNASPILACYGMLFMLSSQCQPYSGLLCHAIYAILPMPALFWLVMPCYLCYPPNASPILACYAMLFMLSSQCQPYSGLLWHAIYAILPMPALFWLVMACYLCYSPNTRPILACYGMLFMLSSQCQPYSGLLCHAIYAILPMPALFRLVMPCYLCYPPNASPILACYGMQFMRSSQCQPYSGLLWHNDHIVATMLWDKRWCCNIDLFCQNFTTYFLSHRAKPLHKSVLMYCQLGTTQLRFLSRGCLW